MSDQANTDLAFMEKAVLWDKGNTIAAFSEGTVFDHHWGRTLNSGDNSLFSALTQMYCPLYFNAEYARAEGHPGCVVAPLLVFNTILGMSVEDLSLRGPFVGITDCVFHRSVYEGDTLTSRSTVIKRRYSERRKGAAIVTWKTEGFNQDGELVLDFVRSNLLMI
jgi:acyl dehydratase